MQSKRSALTDPSHLDSIVSGEQIPALPAGVPKLLEKLSKDDIEIADLGSTLAEFPSIVSRLLFLANSAWSAPVVPIDNIQFACSKLGLSVVRSVSIALSIATPFNPLLCKPFDTYQYWLSALMVGDIAKLLAAEVDAIPESQTSALQTSGILYNIGLLWMADRLPAQTTLALLDYSYEPQTKLDQHLINHCQFDYCAVNGKLAVAWSFPPLLHNTILHHNNHDYNGEYHLQCHSIGLAAAICKHVLSPQLEQIEFRDGRSSLLGLSEESLKGIIMTSTSRKERFEEVIKVFLQAG